MLRTCFELPKQSFSMLIADEGSVVISKPRRRCAESCLGVRHRDITLLRIGQEYRYREMCSMS